MDFSNTPPKTEKSLIFLTNKNADGHPRHYPAPLKKSFFLLPF